jgi:hypothetical protein
LLPRDFEIFVFGINILLPAIHVPNGDYAQQRTADSEGHEQVSSAVSLPQRVVPLLTPRVADIAPRDQGFVEEYGLGIVGADSMPLSILLHVCFVPLETGTGIERVCTFPHTNQCISLPYTDFRWTAIMERHPPALA